MTRLHFASALLPSGWRDDVQVIVSGGTIAGVTVGVAPQGGDERHQLAIPGLASLHSHAFQRGMAGLAEMRGDKADTFWTWRETMYRFALTMTPDDVESVATLLYVEMLERGFTRVGEFHYLHHDRDGSPYANPAEDRKSTRLNSSHPSISYAVFCLKKKKKRKTTLAMVIIKAGLDADISE